MWSNFSHTVCSLFSARLYFYVWAILLSSHFHPIGFSHFLRNLFFVIINLFQAQVLLHTWFIILRFVYKATKNRTTHRMKCATLSLHMPADFLLICTFVCVWIAAMNRRTWSHHLSFTHIIFAVVIKSRKQFLVVLFWWRYICGAAFLAPGFSNYDTYFCYQTIKT